MLRDYVLNVMMIVSRKQDWSPGVRILDDSKLAFVAAVMYRFVIYTGMVLRKGSILTEKFTTSKY